MWNAIRHFIDYIFFRNKKRIKLKWLVFKNADIADTRILLQDKNKPENLLYETTQPYFTRSLEIDISGNISRQIQKSRTEYQLCLLATDSKTFTRPFYTQQCKEIPWNLRNVGSRTGSNYVIISLVLFVLLRTVI